MRVSQHERSHWLGTRQRTNENKIGLLWVTLVLCIGADKQLSPCLYYLHSLTSIIQGCCHPWWMSLTHIQTLIHSHSPTHSLTHTHAHALFFCFVSTLSFSLGERTKEEMGGEKGSPSHAIRTGGDGGVAQSALCEHADTHCALSSTSGVQTRLVGDCLTPCSLARLLQKNLPFRGKWTIPSRKHPPLDFYGWQEPTSAR